MSSFIETPLGYKLHYTTAGNPTGQLTVCLHGLGGSTETFAPLLPHLPPSLRVVCLDFPGFGKSPRPQPPTRISVADHVANLHHLVTSLQAAAPVAEGAETAAAAPDARIFLLGHSLGGIVALQYAALHPATVAGALVLGIGRAGSRIPPARAAMLGLAAEVREQGIEAAATHAMTTNFYADTPERTVDAALRQAVHDAVASSDPEAYAQTCEAIVSDAHVDPDYAKITCPVVFVAGDKDTISPVARSQDLAALVGGPAAVHVVRSGHQMLLEDVDGVKKALSSFWDTADKEKRGVGKQ